MVEVEMRVHDNADVLRREPEKLKGAGYGLLGRLRGLLKRQDLHDMVVVVARVDEEPALCVLDEDRVDREANFTARPLVPEDMITVEDERAAVEQEDLGLRHDPILR